MYLLGRTLNLWFYLFQILFMLIRSPLSFLICRFLTILSILTLFQRYWMFEGNWVYRHQYIDCFFCQLESSYLFDISNLLTLCIVTECCNCFYHCLCSNLFFHGEWFKFTYFLITTDEMKSECFRTKGRSSSSNYDFTCDVLTLLTILDFSGCFHFVVQFFVSIIWRQSIQICFLFIRKCNFNRIACVTSFLERVFYSRD